MKKAIHRLLILTAFLYIVIAKQQCMGTNIQLLTAIHPETGELITEEFRPVKGYEGLYEVSDFGRVKSLQRKVSSAIRNNTTITRKERLLKQGDNRGYKSVVLQIVGDNKNQCKRVHRLVAEVFLPNPLNKPIINHKDCDPSNNHVGNLEWCTQSYNIQYSWNLGRKKVSDEFKKPRFGRENKSARQVVQMTLSGEFVKEWDCVSYIERDLGFSRPNICKCCRGKINTAYGFKWKYA